MSSHSSIPETDRAQSDFVRETWRRYHESLNAPAPDRKLPPSPGTHLAESLASVLARLVDPEFMRTAELTPAWIEAETSGRIGGKPDAGGDALTDFLESLEYQASVDLERATPTFPYRPDGPVYHVREAVHGYDDELVSLIQAQRATMADVESTVGVYQGSPYSYRQLDITGDGDTFDTIPRRGLYACPNAGRDKARVVQSVRGGSYRVDLACEDTEGDCPPCRQHWIDSAVLRFRHGLIGDTQLVITSTGHQTPEVAQKVVTAVGRQLGAVRRAQVLSRTLDYTYSAHIVVTGAMPLPSTLARIAARPGVSAEYRAVSDDDFKALLYSRTKLDLARCPVRFLHWPTAAAAGAATNVYGHNDGYVATATDARNIPPMRLTRRPNLKIPESQRVRIRENEAADNADIWLTGNALDLVELLNLRNARRAGVRSKNDWLACIASGNYDGPKALIRDLAAALDDDGLVSFTARKALRRAATYMTEEG